MDKPWAIAATVLPILPNPITPSTFLRTSTPVYFFRSHLPAFKEALA